MIKIRLHGTKDEISRAIENIRAVFNVMSVSELYKDRGTNEYYRCYIDAINF